MRRVRIHSNILVHQSDCSDVIKLNTIASRVCQMLESDWSEDVESFSLTGVLSYWSFSFESAEKLFNSITFPNSLFEICFYARKESKISCKRQKHYTGSWVWEYWGYWGYWGHWGYWGYLGILKKNRSKCSSYPQLSLFSLLLFTEHCSIFIF